MVTSVGNAGPGPNNMSGIGIYCNVIDPSKLPPDHPILKGNMPNCTVVGPGMGGGCYPAGYYLNNYTAEDYGVSHAELGRYQIENFL